MIDNNNNKKFSSKTIIMKLKISICYKFDFKFKIRKPLFNFLNCGPLTNIVIIL